MRGAHGGQRGAHLGLELGQNRHVSLTVTCACDVWSQNWRHYHKPALWPVACSVRSHCPPQEPCPEKISVDCRMNVHLNFLNIQSSTSGSKLACPFHTLVIVDLGVKCQSFMIQNIEILTSRTSHSAPKLRIL